MSSSDTFPRAFGRYTLLEPLAQGGMGSLYLACQGDPGMEKLCVVKTVLRELADKEYLARFRDEAKVVVRLTHGNLVPVFDAGTVAGELYVAMEYIDGKDLRAVWNRCARKQIAFPVDVALHIVKELCRGLHHAHGFGELKLVHRDVSPPNVLIAFSGEVKLTDFGLASSTLKLEHTAPGVIYGKVSYMSPEQARGAPLDGRTDLYAAGVILWELLTGRQLFPAGEDNTLDRVRDPKVDPPSTRAARVTRALDALVLKALARDPADRYADCEAFRAALAEHLAREAPATDAARVTAFLRQLFDDEIEDDRRRRDRLVAGARAGRVDVKRLEQMTPPDVNLAELDLSAPTSAGILNTLVDGRYQVNRLVGEGGMGRVYEAEHVEIGKRVALKVLHPSYSRHAEAVQRFRREARAAAQLGHPNIVDVTDSGTTPEGAVYFVMEFLEGRDLADTLSAEGRLSVDRTIDIGVQIARALHAAHQAGIIHRDLKPENVFLVARHGRRDFAKVLDFGIARHTEMSPRGDGKRPRRLTNPNMAMGTPEYMAPEQAVGHPADARSDVYAAGAILYEMLVGTPPHTGQNFVEIISRKSEPAPAVACMRSDVGRELSEVIAAALEKDPAARPQSMEELARRLERCRPDRRSRAKGEPGVEVARAEVAHAAADARGDASEAARVVMPPWRTVAIAAAVAMLLLLVTVAIVRAMRSEPAAAARRPIPAAPLSVAAGLDETERLDPAVVPASSTGTDRAAPEKARMAPTDRVRKERRAPAVAPVPVGGPSLGEAQHLLAENDLGSAEKAFLGHYRSASGVDRGAAATGLARVAYERGFYVDSIRWAERAVQEGGGWPAHLALGDAYMKALRFDAAAREYRAVLKQRPEHAEAQRRLEQAEKKAG